MWKIYDVTNGLGHTFCNDISTARRVLACIMKEIERDVTEVEITLNGDSFSYYGPNLHRTYTFEIREVSVWNRVPDFLKKFDDAE